VKIYDISLPNPCQFIIRQYEGTEGIIKKLNEEKKVK
jgi:hypothetical protein